jgi:hypothetical protein
MKSDKQFILTLVNTILKENIKHYTKAIAHPNFVGVPLTKDQKDRLEIFIDGVMQDTISSVLGVLEGSSLVSEVDYQLIIKDTKEIVSGDLQDFFHMYLEDGEFID